MNLWKRVSKLISSQVNHWIDDLEEWVEHKEHSQKNSSSEATSKSNVDPKLAQYYANLEVPYGASLEEVKQSYRRLIKQYHPDRYEQDPHKRQTAEQILKKLNEAFDYLEAQLHSTEKDGSV